MKYINAKTSYGIETLDEFKTTKEARAMLKEYQSAHKGTGITHYISSRSTKQWKAKP